MESAYDAVVVGCGCGAAITACRLAENGWRVCVLERSRRFGPERGAEHLIAERAP